MTVAMAPATLPRSLWSAAGCTLYWKRKGYCTVSPGVHGAGKKGSTHPPWVARGGAASRNRLHRERRSLPAGPQLFLRLQAVITLRLRFSRNLLSFFSAILMTLVIFTSSRAPTTQPQATH